MNPRTATRISAAVGFLAVALGAAGAHGPLQVRLELSSTLAIWETAARYHLVHAVVLLFLASRARITAVWYLFLGGIVLFSGSLYVLATAGQLRGVGLLTPLGGMGLLAAWLLLAVRGLPA